MATSGGGRMRWEPPHSSGDEVASAPAGLSEAKAPGLIASVRGRVTVSLFGLVIRVRFGLDLALVLEPLSDEDVARAIPHGEPHETKLPGHVYDVVASEERRRATLWAAALEATDAPAHDRLEARGAVFSTYGFVRVDDRVQLGVVRYVTPRSVLMREKPMPLEVERHRFPTVVRPWVAVAHGGPADPRRASCWVSYEDGDGERRAGVLTARHALKPDDAKVGADVAIDANRGDPPGRLHCESARMDAAVVEIPGTTLGEPVTGSVVPGLKPIRLMTAAGPVDTEVLEVGGVLGGTILGVPGGNEPLTPALVVLAHSLDRGDSGCIGLDTEFVSGPDDPGRPYLLYQGKANLKQGGVYGYGLLVEQPRNVWSLQFHEPPT